MHKNVNSPSQLTEFVPHSDDVKPSGNFFSRLFKKNTGEQYPRSEQDPFAPVSNDLNDDEYSDDDRISTDDIGPDVDSLSESSANVVCSGSGGEPAPAARTMHAPPARTLSSVVKRLSHIVAGRTQTPKAYKDSDYKQYWMPDDNCRECYDCGMKFHAFRRRHHCRICGQIFCSQCCNQAVPGKIMGFTGFLRVCTYCCKVATQYAQNPDVSYDLQSLEDGTQRSLTGSSSNMGTSGTDSTSSLTAAESPSRTNTLHVPSSSLGRRSSKSHRLSSIFDEDVKQRSRSTADAEASLLNSLHRECKAMLQDSTKLQDLCTLMKHGTDGVDTHSVRQRMNTYTDCMVGSDIVNWLMSRGEATTREQAVVLGQALVDGKWIMSTTVNDNLFHDDHTLYRPVEMALRDEPAELMSLPQTLDLESEDEDGPLWVKKISQNGGNGDVSRGDQLSDISQVASSSGDIDITNSSVFYVDSPLFLGPMPQSVKIEQTSTPVEASNRGHRTSVESVGTVQSNVDAGLLPTITPHRRLSSVAIPEGQIVVEASEENAFSSSETCSTHDKDGFCEENIEQQSRELHSKSHTDHLTNLVSQMLERRGLSSKWADTVLTITQKISRCVRPDVRNDNDDMDIRQYVTFKTISGGSPSDTSIINGVVCSKTVAHRKMKQEIAIPRILLLRSPIEYQRVENKFSSLEPQILQEHEYLRNCVGRIATLQPDIVLVEKTVSRLAQGYLLDAGITLVINVKPSVMERVARFTQATIIATIDGLVNKTTMGSCASFYMCTFSLLDGSTKSLMYFDGCATNLGCTVTLRGGPQAELKAVKKIMRFMTYAMYNARLETAFLVDEYALPSQLISCDSSNSVDLFGSMTSNPISPIAVDGRASQAKTSSLSSVEKCDGLKEDEDKLSRIIKEVASPETPGAQPATDESIFQCSIPIIESANQSSKENVHRENSDRFRKALDETALSVSPFVRYTVPYLKTEAGSGCLLRHFFPTEIYWSNYHAGPLKCTNTSDEMKREPTDDASISTSGALPKSVVSFLPSHPFVVEKLIKPASSPDIQALISDFRARGGRIAWSVTLRGSDATNSDKERGSDNKLDAGTVASSNPMPDCLDPFNHQRISVLFSSFSYESTNAPAPCVFPWVVTMEYYSRNDITLGGFLERYCFREAYRCSNRNCDVPMSNHVRRFVHGNGCLQIVMKRLDMMMPGTADTIYMWSFCKKCRERSPATVMSSDTWLFSFAKYLELHFNALSYQRTPVPTTCVGPADDKETSSTICTHSLHYDHYQYFGSQNVVVLFRYSALTLKEVVLPSVVIQILPVHISLQHLEDNGKMLHFQSNAVFMAILEQLHRLKKEVQTDAQASKITDHVLLLQNEQDSVVQKIEYVQSLIVNAKRVQHDDEGHNCNLGLQVQDAFVGIKHEVAELVTDWNARIHDFELQMKKPAEKNRTSASINVTVSSASRSSVTSGSLLTSSCAFEDKPCDVKSLKDDEDQTFMISTESGQSFATASTMSNYSVWSHPPEVVINNSTDGVSACGTASDKLCESISSASSRADSPICDQTTVSSKVEESDSVSVGSSALTGDSLKTAPRSRTSSDNKKPVKSVVRDVGAAVTTVDPERKDRTGAVKQILSSLLSGGGNTTIQVPFPADEHHLLASCQKVPVTVLEHELSSIIAYALSSHDYEQNLRELRVQISLEESSSSNVAQKRSARPHDKSTPAAECETGDLAGKKGVLSFLKGTASTTRDKSPVNSGAKFDVDSVKYTPRATDRDSIEDGDDVIESSSSNVSESHKSAAAASKSSIRQQPINYHIDLQFADISTNFFCRVCFADQFCKLRKLIFPDGEERYIRSLSRCFTWLARGGKSGSTFCKTQAKYTLEHCNIARLQASWAICSIKKVWDDCIWFFKMMGEDKEYKECFETADDRFILKQMSRYEVQSFTEFAPHYFSYIANAHAAKKPTVLAKVVGVYKIGFHNTKTNAQLKQDLLVMENLFYNRKVTQIYDLKGSARNRLVSTSGKKVEDLVLLDENLMKVSVDSPLYIHTHSKAVLTSAITRDTQFLAKHLVMDYSLLVGVDETNNQLLIGIIDYIRTFTWDKMLEMLLKKNFSGAAPTIVSPDHYRRRFLEAMDRYFLLVPDQWTGLGRTLE